jgi:AcrR family transcriptional regulator
MDKPYGVRLQAKKRVEKRAWRVGLSKSGIEAEALAEIEDNGVEEFSLRKLATRMGCEPMSLYHHFPSKAHLMDALVDRVMGTLKAPPGIMPWRLRITALVHDFRAMAHRHPAFFQYLALHRLNTATGLKWLNGTLEAFREAGLDEEDTARLFRIFGYFIVGAALDETSGYAKGPSAREPVPDAVVKHEYPAVIAAGPYFAPSQFDRTFEEGLAILLDGMAARLKHKRTRP